MGFFDDDDPDAALMAINPNLARQAARIRANRQPAPWEGAHSIGELIVPQGWGDVAVEAATSLPLPPQMRIPLAAGGLLMSDIPEALAGRGTPRAAALAGRAAARSEARTAAAASEGWGSGVTPPGRSPLAPDIDLPQGQFPGSGPNRLDAPIPRFQAPKGVSARLQNVMNRLEADPALRQQFLDTAREGEDIGRRWYNTEGLRHRFIKELGEQEGDVAWRDFLGHVAAASPGSNVPANIRNASYQWTVPADELERRRAAYLASDPDPKKRKWPTPQSEYGSYGHQYQNLQSNYAELQREGGPMGLLEQPDPLTAPKPRGFGASFFGGEHNIAADMHFMRLLGMLADEPGFLSGSASISKDMADRLRRDFPDIKIGEREIKLADGKTQVAYEFNPKAAVKAAGGADSELYRAIKNHPSVWDQLPGKNEYAAYEQIAQQFAKELNMTPAQFQASLWMGGAKRTGVHGDSLDTFEELFLKNLQARAAERGTTPDELFSRFARREVPLAVPLVAGGAAAGGGLLEEGPSQ